MVRNPKVGEKLRLTYKGSLLNDGYAFCQFQRKKGRAIIVDCDGDHDEYDSFDCREDFQEDWHSQTGILFFHSENRNQADSIAAALAYVERKIGRSKARSVVGPTTRSDITWIRLSKWWVQNGIRKSFLTILLRAAANLDCKKKGFVKDLFRVGDPQGFFKKTKPAVERFMKGYTRPSDEIEGEMWMEAFYNFGFNSEDMEYGKAHPAKKVARWLKR